MTPAAWTRSYISICKSQSQLWIISVMTLLTLALYPSGASFYGSLNILPIILIFLFPAVVQREEFWLAVCLLVGSAIALNWYYVGNHTFLLFYWVLALLLSCFAKERLKMLSLSARWLIGLPFLFAFVWKLISNDFRSGSTMQYLISATYPMGNVGVALTHLTPADLAQNIERVQQVISNPQAGSVALMMPAELPGWANLLTFTTQLLEGGIALVFLAPLPERWRWWREATLLLFFLTAYTLLPVGSFAAQFACMGYAMTTSTRLRTAFIASFFLFQAMNLLLGLFRP